MSASNFNKLNSSNAPMHACGCVGPQNGDPVCPCKMRGMKQENGRWVEIIDHGPVKSSREAALAFKSLAWGQEE